MTKVLTTEQWKEIEKTLESPYGYAKLLVDGYTLALAVQPIKPRHYVIATYVNGSIRGEWMFKECEERRRFFCEKRAYGVSARMRAQFLRKFGKRAYAESSISKSFSVFAPYWSSFTELRRHLLANNKSIEVINEKIT